MRSSILVYGGGGSLGQVTVSLFKARGWSATSVDFIVSPEAEHSVIIPRGHWGTQLAHVLDELEKLGRPKFDVVFCAAGGWTGGNITQETTALVEGFEHMLSFNLHSAIACASVAARVLKPGGLLVLTGAAAALNGTPGMLAYGCSKAATHHLVKSLAAKDSSMPEGSSVVCLLPITLDTPPNRKAMPNADTSTWTPLSFVAETIHRFADQGEKPKSGSFFKLVTRNNESSIEKVEDHH